MMSRYRNLRSVFAQTATLQCRNFSAGSRSRRNLSSSGSSIVSKGASFLIQGTGATSGCIVGYYLFGGKIDKYEKQRQQIVMDVFGDPAEVEDLRAKMWPEFRKMAWFRNMEKIWSESDLKKNMELMDSDLRKNMETMWAKLSDEKMWSDVKGKMFSDGES